MASIWSSWYSVLIEWGFFDGSHHDGFCSLIVLLDHLEVQGCLIHCLEVGLGALHDVLPYGFMESRDEHLGLEELPSVLGSLQSSAFS